MRLSIGLENADDLIEDLTRQIQVKGTTRDNLYTLAYRDTSPDRAKRVVQALTSFRVARVMTPLLGTLALTS